ncbi:hypothetical protein AAG570_012828 [Ranatra chinensis]|uniref:Uncharacterized protein n=1 Tax=Ranatra chinensis TaxID=642074 RepID=A0ABD0Z385_9HEMI
MASKRRNMFYQNKKQDFRTNELGARDDIPRKVVVESSTSALEYGDHLVYENSPVNADLHFDAQMMHLYVMTEKQSLDLRFFCWSEPVSANRHHEPNCLVRSSCHYCLDMKYDEDSSAEDGDWPKPVRTEVLTARDGRPRYSVKKEGRICDEGVRYDWRVPVTGWYVRRKMMRLVSVEWDTSVNNSVKYHSVTKEGRICDEGVQYDWRVPFTGWYVRRKMMRLVCAEWDASVNHSVK